MHCAPDSVANSCPSSATFAFFRPFHLTQVPRFFFFNDTATTEIYTLSLHDALPISEGTPLSHLRGRLEPAAVGFDQRSEENTSELQSLTNLVRRLLLEKK